MIRLDVKNKGESQERQPVESCEAIVVACTAWLQVLAHSLVRSFEYWL
jgi:hypothetical protein